jgi:hypothetical protein
MQSLLRVQAADYEQLRIVITRHEDGILRSVPSTDGSFRAIVSRDCQSGSWSLHLRLKHEPNYNSRMSQGFGDPSLLCHFDRRASIKSINWPESSGLKVIITGRRSGATLKDEALGVKVSWVFEEPSLRR